MSINVGGSPSNEEQMTLPKNGQTTIGGHYNGHEKEQTTYATIGNGSITVGGEEQTDIAGLNRDITNAQEITKDIELGGLDASVTVDHRLLSEEGRNDIAENFEDTFEHGEDIVTATQNVFKEDDLGMLDFGETLHNNATVTQLKNDLLRNPENKELVANLSSENEAVKAQAIKDLGHLAQLKFDLDLSEINLYEADKTTSVSLADSVISDIKGGVVVDRTNAQAGNIMLDVSDENLTGTDLMNTLGHEVLETQAYQGKDGLFLGSNDEQTQEALGIAYGKQFADRINQAVSEYGGDLNGSYTTSSNRALKNSQTVYIGTQAANEVGSAKVDYRQATKGEILLIDRIADDYAKQENISPDEARSLLTQQALSMIDEKWASQTHIEEAPQAITYLMNAAKEEGSLHYDANGQSHLAFELAKNENYYESNLNNSHTNELENVGATEPVQTEKGSELHKIDKGWITKYATEDGHSPYVDGIASGTVDALANDAQEILDAISQLTVEKVSNALVAVAENTYDTLTNPDTYKPEYTEGDRGKKEIAIAQGDKETLIEINKTEYIDDVETIVALTTLGVGSVVKGAGKEVVEEVVEQARKGGDSSGVFGGSVVSDNNLPSSKPENRVGDSAPYDPNKKREDIEHVFGEENVTSTTNPKNPLQRVNSNPDKGVEVITDSYSNKAVRVKYKDPVTGESTSANIPYDNRGLVVFDDHSKFTTRIDKTVDYDSQFPQATRDLKNAIVRGDVNTEGFTPLQLKQISSEKPKIQGFTWHHDASGKMQLVPTDVHKAVSHIGDALDKGK